MFGFSDICPHGLTAAGFIFTEPISHNIMFVSHERSSEALRIIEKKTRSEPYICCKLPWKQNS